VIKIFNPLNIFKIFTKDFKQSIPLFYVTIDKDKFKTQKENSCICNIHPCVSQLDKSIQEDIRYHINEAIDLIRDNVRYKDL
jgi:hypothetical protein